jgi:hypothetical protein
MRDKFPIKAILALLALLALILAIGLTLSPSLSPADEKAVDHWEPVDSKKAIKLADLKKTFGVELVGLRRSAAGHILDLGYRIIDRDKAKPFVEGRIKPYLVDRDRKLLLHVPSAQKVGKLRQQHLSARPDFVYFMLFGNIGRLVQAGDHVTVVFGNFRIDDVIVQG